MKTVIFKTLFSLALMCIFSTSNAQSLNQKFETSLSYLNFSEKNNSGSLNHMDLDLKYNASKKLTKNLKFNSYLRAEFLTYPDYMITAPEFEVVYDFKDGGAIHIGRTRVKYGSYLDQDWIMGVQSAFSRMNPLDPEIQGITALSYRFESEQVFANLYGSPISIPDQNSSIELDNNGKVTSDNPWTVLPPSRIRLDTGAVIDLKYDLIDDSVPELLNAYQFGGTLGVKTDFLDIFVMYANRPSKQLGFELDARLRGSVVEVTSKPLFRREHFFGIQSESRWSKNLKMKNGFYGLVLIDDDSEAAYKTSHPDYFFITTAFDIKFSDHLISLSHLYSNKRENEEVDGVLYIESTRFLYEDALMISYEGLKFGDFNSSYKLVYAYEEGAAQFSFKGLYNWSRKLNLWANLNLIHDLEEEKVSSSENLSISSGLSGYAALDHLQLGVSYVF